MSADFSCKCLNIRIRVVARAATTEFQGINSLMQQQHPTTVLVCLRDPQEAFSRVKSTPVNFAKVNFQAENQLSRDPFFAAENCKILEPLEDSPVEILVSVHFPALVRYRSIETDGGWLIGRCLVCDNDVWAYPKFADVKRESATEKSDVFFRFSTGTQILVSRNLLDRDRVSVMMESSEFSAAIGLVCPTGSDNECFVAAEHGDLINTESGVMERCVKNQIHKSPSSSSVDRQESSSEGGDQVMGEGFTGFLAQSEAAQQIQAACSEYLRREQECMDTRIRAFIERETLDFEAKRQKAKADRDLMLRELENKTLILGDISSLTRTERQKSGGEESANDSAVPLSPVSLASLNEPSPATGLPVTPASPLQPKNQLLMGQSSQTEGNMIPSGDEDLFSFDEDHPTAFSGCGLSGVLQTPGYLPADDEAETDDSGTGDDYSRYYPPYYNKSGSAIKPQSTNSGVVNEKEAKSGVSARGLTAITGISQKRTEGVGQLAFGTSMPVKIPGKYWPPKDAKDSIRQSEVSSSDEENDEFLLHRTVVHKRRNTGSGGVGVGPHDVAASMRALARSIQAADDPERLFGEYPQRRRYKTGDVVRMRTKAGSGSHNTAAGVFPEIVRAHQ